MRVARDDYLIAKSIEPGYFTQNCAYPAKESISYRQVGGNFIWDALYGVQGLQSGGELKWVFSSRRVRL